MEKFNPPFGDEDLYFCELPNFELKFFAGPPLACEIFEFKRAGVKSAG